LSWRAKGKAISLDIIARDKLRDPGLKEINHAVIAACASITQGQAGETRSSQ
jgi:hypothetical protein